MLSGTKAEGDRISDQAIFGLLILWQSKVLTKKGIELGIQTIDKISSAGNLYTLLMYPKAVQEMILDYFAELRTDGERPVGE